MSGGVCIIVFKVLYLFLLLFLVGEGVMLLTQKLLLLVSREVSEVYSSFSRITELHLVPERRTNNKTTNSFNCP